MEKAESTTVRIMPLLVKSLTSLRSYVELKDFEGWDPYDGLNSRVFRALWPLPKIPIARLAWIQFFKRSRFNLRRLMIVPEGTNPKALALFASGYSELYRQTGESKDLERAIDLVERLLSVASPGHSRLCWGYNFDWQARAGFTPAYIPTGVVTSFGGYALLDAYELTGSQRYLDAAVSASEFMIGDLNRTQDTAGGICFSYSPFDTSQVYNASLLVAKLLARTYSLTGNPRFLSLASASVSFCCNHQSSDGSWVYSTGPYGQWIDSFHTGFNLECISEYIKYTEDRRFVPNLQLGVDYYLNTFFTEDGLARYYSNATYPVDIHSIAQLFSTLCAMNAVKTHKELINRVLKWSVENMQDPQGYFYYQFTPRHTNRISYMRWGQAWMFYGLSKLYNAMKSLQETRAGGGCPDG